MNLRLINSIKGRYLLLIIITLILTDITIILDISYLREALSFLFFTIIPGLIIIQVLKPELEFVKKTLLWVGISIALLISTGLILNALYPSIEYPLSLKPVLITLNGIMIGLVAVAYKFKPDNFCNKKIFNFNLDLKGKLISPLILPILFPLLAVIGTYSMNLFQNNIILMILLFLIPIHIIIITYFNEKIHPINYPLALWLIGMSLLLMHSLTSNFVLGRDVHIEYYTFQLTLNSHYWDINQFYNPYNACLSINILPTIYQVLSDMNPEYVFKLFFAIIGSILPVVLYKVLENFLKNRNAFLASLLLVFQAFFINLTGCIRQEVAILFFFLSILVLYQKDFSKSIPLKALFLILVFSMVMSHYTTSYVALVILVPLLLIPFFKGLLKERKIISTNLDVIVLYILFVAVWFIFYANVQFQAGSEVIGATVGATVAATGTSLVARESTILNMIGIGVKSLPNLIAIIINDLIFLTIGLGLLRILWKHKHYMKKLGDQYLLGSLLSVALLAGFIILPYISFYYGPDRLFFQLLIFTGPLFIFGCLQLGKIVKKPQITPFIVLIMLLSVFAVNTHLQYNFLGEPFSVEYNDKGVVRGELFIYNGEVSAAKWIKNYGYDNSSINGDAISYSRLLMGGVKKSSIKGINFNNHTVDGYLYLGFYNLNENKFFETYELQTSVDKYSYFFYGKSKIYQNGIATIWL